MIEINLPIQIRWADLDPNFHVLHSKYYDFGAFCRMVYLTENGISTALLTENNIGPILLKEDCNFSLPNSGCSARIPILRKFCSIAEII